MSWDYATYYRRAIMGQQPVAEPARKVVAEECVRGAHEEQGGCYVCCVACWELSHTCQQCGAGVTHSGKGWEPGEWGLRVTHECD